MLKNTYLFIFLLTSHLAYDQSTNRVEVELSTFNKPNWKEQEAANAKRIADVVQNFMNNHNFDHIIN